MFGKTNPEVLVVGAGPVGLWAALALAKHGIQVAIVDKEWRTGAHSYALALHPHSLSLLQELGIREEVLERAFAVRTIGLYDGQKRRFGLQVPDTASPVAVLRQDVLEQVLEQALERAGVPVLWNHAVSRLVSHPESAVATVDKMVKESVGYAVARTEWMVAKSAEVQVPFVIGADGHQSLVRRALGSDFTATGPAQHFAVFEFETSAQLGDEMRIMFGERTTDVLWPLPDQHCRWSFELVDDDAPAATRTKNRLPVEIGNSRFPRLDEERLRELVAERAPWFAGQIGQIFWRIMVRFEKRRASSFGHDHVWLAGDSGHLTGPAGMQSMNIGLREATQLADILANMLRGRGSVGQLADYERERVSEWQFLLGQKGGLTSDAHTDPWIAQCSPRLLSCLPASGADLAALGRQIGLAVH
ncbi:MAG: FAD-dependent oxidoreductase [Pirellulaceae bacterium]